MAHFVKIQENRYISEAIVISNADCGGGDFPESEPIGQEFISNVLNLDGLWKQTSYNNNFRVRYASVGMLYNEVMDSFEFAPREEQ
jgi:hypothetical protein